MRKYHVLMAYDVPYYHTIVVEARNAANAEKIAQAKLAHIDSSLFEPAWDGSSDYRVVDIIDAAEARS
jgi:hypothetical protein